MNTALTIREDYEEIFYVVCKRSKSSSDNNDWMFHHKYLDLGKAKLGLKDLMSRNTRYEYKIRKFVVTGKDIITDQTLSLLDNRDTCDCFYCGKTIESGDELIFGDATEEIYCSHKCVSKSMDNEEFTVLSNTDKYEYLPWFTEKEM